jgi:hypothetical protein
VGTGNRVAWVDTDSGRLVRITAIGSRVIDPAVGPGAARIGTEGTSRPCGHRSGRDGVRRGEAR